MALWLAMVSVYGTCDYQSSPLGDTKQIIILGLGQVHSAQDGKGTGSQAKY